MIYLHNALDYAQLALGLGIVIFVHELGHFLAAKYCDVKVEQFAIGFGPAIIAYRKGIGFRWGTTTPDYNKAIHEHIEKVDKDELQLREKEMPTLDYAATVGTQLGLGETEYRFNWVPLGGYVKMLGQDDLRPGMTAEDPRAYNKKSVGARMIIVSAGVVMNIIFAAIGFMVLFMVGYPVPPAIVGGVIAGSPAARAVRADGKMVGLQPGDEITSYRNKPMMGDFSRIPLNVALTYAGTDVALGVKHPDGKTETLYTMPQREGEDGKGLLELGVIQPFELSAQEAFPEDETDNAATLAKIELPDEQALNSGDVITQIDGKAVIHAPPAAGIAQLYSALNDSDGKPVGLTVEGPDGKIRHTSVTPHFGLPFTEADLSILGMSPRATVLGLIDSSPALGKLIPGDVILAVDAASDHLSNPTVQQLRKTILQAGDHDVKVSLTVLDPGQTTPRVVADLQTYRLPQSGGRMGLGIAPLGTDEQHLVVAETLKDGPAAGKIPTGATLTAVNGQAINNWFELRKIVADGKAGEKLAITFDPPDVDGKPSVATIELTQNDIDDAKAVTLTEYLPLHTMMSERHTHNPFYALSWGVDETRDLILQFYVTLQRMVTGGVALSNVMGPVGMAHEGALVASRGATWLLWFLCLISANLAVVNFLPIPIVDGGLFTLLILEKVQGKPLSAEAQRIVQMVGLVLILGVFLLVTYQDIARWAGY
jgi:regulator of sigma E protease